MKSYKKLAKQTILLCTMFLTVSWKQAHSLSMVDGILMVLAY